MIVFKQNQFLKKSILFELSTAMYLSNFVHFLKIIVDKIFYHCKNTWKLNASIPIKLFNGSSKILTRLWHNYFLYAFICT